MSRIDLDSKERDDSLEDALQDLESLMAKAKEMVRSLVLLSFVVLLADSLHSSTDPPRTKHVSPTRPLSHLAFLLNTPIRSGQNGRLHLVVFRTFTRRRNHIGSGIFY